jgi:hypothetical protein
MQLQEIHTHTKGPEEGTYERSREGRMREEDDMLLQSISQGPSRVFVLAKGAVPPEDERLGHNDAAGCQNQVLHQLGNWTTGRVSRG